MTTLTINEKATVQAIGEVKGNKCKPVIRSDGMVFTSIIDAAKASNADRGSVCRCCQGKNSTAGGYGFKYLSKATENLDDILEKLRNALTEISTLQTQKSALETELAESRARIEHILANTAGFDAETIAEWKAKADAYDALEAARKAEEKRQKLMADLEQYEAIVQQTKAELDALNGNVSEVA